MTPPQAGPPRLLWSINARAVLEVVEDLAPVARPELTRSTGLSKTTVAQTLAVLQQRGIVIESGHDDARRGPVATLYDLASGLAHGIAVDIGHHRVRASVVDLRGQRLARAEAPADHSSEAALVAVTTRLVDEVIAESGIDRATLTHTVVGVPAVVSPSDGALRLVSGIADEGRDLPALLAAALPATTGLENDTNLAAIAEDRWGRGAGAESFVLLSIGAAVGSGIVLRGELMRGFTGAAGEVAYLPAMPAGVPEILGARSLAEDAATAGADSADARTLFARAAQGDAAALDVLEATAARIADIAASICFVLDPALVVLGGAIGASGSLLAPMVQRRLTETQPLLQAQVVASTAGEDAVLRGAEVAVWQHIREDAFARAVAPD